MKYIKRNIVSVCILFLMMCVMIHVVPHTQAAVPTGDLNGWKQVYTDDFNTDVPLGSFPDAVSTKWRSYTGKDTSGHGTYSPHSVVSVNSGVMTANIHTSGTTHMVAAMLPKYTPMTYGRFAVRWRSDRLPGYKVAWLLWPDDGVKAEGEIDWPEMNLDSTSVSGFLHRKNAVASQGYVSVPIDSTVWHTTVVEWSPNLLVFSMDGIERYRDNVGVPNTPMHWVLQNETALGGAPAPADDVAGNIQVDWVSIWKYDPTAIGPDVPKTAEVIAPASVTGTVALSAVTSSDVDSAAWVVRSTQVGADTTAPFNATWDSTKSANGIQNLYVQGHTAEGWFNGPAHKVTVKNPWDINIPSIVKGTISLPINHQYTWIKQAQWVVDGKNIASDTTTPFSYTWDSHKVANGSHVIYVKTYGSLINGVPSWVNGPKHTITVAN